MKATNDTYTCIQRDVFYAFKFQSHLNGYIGRKVTINNTFSLVYKNKEKLSKLISDELEGGTCAHHK